MTRFTSPQSSPTKDLSASSDGADCWLEATCICEMMPQAGRFGERAMGTVFRREAPRRPSASLRIALTTLGALTKMRRFLRFGTASNAEERLPVYAVFRTGGKQYRVSPGDRLRVERLDAQVGDVIDFDQVLLVGDGTDIRIGKPLVPGGKVQGKVLGQGRTKKIEIVKFKRRAHYRRTAGHRQPYTEVEITSISGGDAA